MIYTITIKHNNALVIANIEADYPIDAINDAIDDNLADIINLTGALTIVCKPKEVFSHDL